MKKTIANFVLLPLFALPAVISSFTPQELDERRICPAACYGEPLAEGFKGESPLGRRPGFHSSPEKGMRRGRWVSPNIGKGLPLQVDYGPAGLAGLSEVQIWRLGRGEIVLPDSLIKTEEGKTLIEIPLLLGVVGVLVAPQLAAVGAIAALLTRASIVVEKVEEQ